MKLKAITEKVCQSTFSEPGPPPAVWGGGLYETSLGFGGEP